MAELIALIPLLYPFAMIWHWVKQDRPAFRYLGSPRAERTALVLTVATILAGWATFAVAGLRLGMTPATWVWAPFMVAWLVLIIYGHPTFNLLRRLTGEQDVRGALRNILWTLGLELPSVSRGSRDPVRGNEVDSLVEWLSKLRTQQTAPLIDLWLAEVEAAKSGDWDKKAAAERHRAIQSEARRLWPDGDDWKVAALVG